MNVKITHLKAPWPEGAKVGDVVAFEGAVPAWALGKCSEVADDAQVDHIYEAPAVAVSAGVVPGASDVEELRKKLADAEAAAADAQKLAADEKARGDELAKKLADAEAAAAKGKASK